MSRALSVFSSLLIVAVMLAGCGPSNAGKVTPYRVKQLGLSYEPAWLSDCRKKRIAEGVGAILADWEWQFGMKSRAITITFSDGTGFWVQRTFTFRGLPRVATVTVDEVFVSGGSYAKTVTGTHDELPRLWHLLCHINLVGTMPGNPDLADMAHTHPDWPTWDSLGIWSPSFRHCP